MGTQNNDNSVDYAKKAKNLPASTQTQKLLPNYETHKLPSTKAKTLSIFFL